jgi:hypothetical protein
MRETLQNTVCYTMCSLHSPPRSLLYPAYTPQLHGLSQHPSSSTKQPRAMETSRYQLVDSLYGPGTVGAWLLTLTAVLISWTLNLSTRRKDTLSIDLIGALLRPLVAADHLAWQLHRLPYPIIETITSKGVEVQKYASALEAPLNICETFSMVALLAAAACGPWWGSRPKLRRLVVVLATGVICWGWRI